MAGIAGQHFPTVPPPTGGWSGNRNAWDRAEFLGGLINRISADPSGVETVALSRLKTDIHLATYRDLLRRALSNQRSLRRELEYRQPDKRQTVTALSDGAPANVSDLHASLIVNLRDHATPIASANNDIYK
jgi:hypothetical protein